MEKTHKAGIGTIHYGEIHVWYPFSFASKISLSQSIEKIIDSDISINDSFFEKEKTIERNFSEEQIDAETNKAKRVLELIDKNNELYALLLLQSGDYFGKCQRRILLRPLTITFKNGDVDFIPVSLYIFENNIGVYKIGYPIEEAEIIEMKQNKYEGYIEKIYYEEEKKNFDSFYQVVKYLDMRLAELFDGHVVSSNKNALRFIFISNYGGIPKNRKPLCNEIKKRLISNIKF